MKCIVVKTLLIISSFLMNGLFNERLLSILHSGAFVLDQFPYHVWVGEYQRSAFGDSDEEIHTIEKIVVHENYNRVSHQNDIGTKHIFMSINLP